MSWTPLGGVPLCFSANWLDPSESIGSGFPQVGSRHPLPLTAAAIRIHYPHSHNLTFSTTLAHTHTRFGSPIHQTSFLSPPQARERLSIILAQQRAENSPVSALNLQAMQMEILEVVRKYVPIQDTGDVNVTVRREGTVEVVEMSVNVPPSSDFV